MRKKITWLIALWCLSGMHESQAQPQLGLERLGGQIGFVNPEGPFGTAIGLDLMANFGQVAENLELEGKAGYWSKGEGLASLRDFFVSSSVIYKFHVVMEQFTPFAGGGLSLHFMRSKSPQVGPPGTSFISHPDTQIGIDLRGGALYLLNEQIDFLGEIQWTLGDAEQFHIKFGVLFKFTVE